MHYLHTASRRIIELLVAERIGTLILGEESVLEDPGRVRQEAQPGICADPACEVSEPAGPTSAEEVGIKVIVTEESYTSQASFLDLDV